MVIRREALAAASSHKWRPRGHRHRTTKRRAIIWLQRGGPGQRGPEEGGHRLGPPLGLRGHRENRGGFSAAGLVPRSGGSEGCRRWSEFGGSPAAETRPGTAPPGPRALTGLKATGSAAGRAANPGRRGAPPRSSCWSLSLSIILVVANRESVFWQLPPRRKSAFLPQDLVNQSGDGDGLRTLSLASGDANQRFSLPLDLRFRPSYCQFAPIGGAVSPSPRPIALRNCRSRSRHWLIGQRPRAGRRLGRRPPRGRVAQGGARAAPQEEDGAVRGSEPPPPPPRPVCAGPRRGRARLGGGCRAGGAAEPARSGQEGERGLLGPPKPCAERAGGASGARVGAGPAPRPASPGRTAATAGKGGGAGRWIPVRGGAGAARGGCAVGAPRRLSVPRELRFAPLRVPGVGRDGKTQSWCGIAGQGRAALGLRLSREDKVIPRKAWLLCE